MSEQISDQIEASSSCIDAFFTRNGLPASTRALCWEFIRHRCPDLSTATEAPSQGYCSFTFCLGDDTIIQFRPPAHQIDPGVTNRAREVFGDYAPDTRFIGKLSVPISGETKSLFVYTMSRIRGISLAQVRLEWRASDVRTRVIREREELVRGFAELLARSWKKAVKPADPDLPHLKGTVGWSLRWRLNKMHSDLPARFRRTVEKVLERLHDIEALSWVLTHGDLVPANIMLALNQGTEPGLRLSGLLDWAEAEYLPFGVCLYGLEELLGESTTTQEGGNVVDSNALRSSFWAELETLIPEVRSMCETVRLAGLLGVLLWHGIAFDDGRLDRVVQEGVDDEEIQRLDVMLDGKYHKEGVSRHDRHYRLESAQVVDEKREQQKQPRRFEAPKKEEVGGAFGVALHYQRRYAWRLDMLSYTLKGEESARESGG
ncbi:hypothetical protein QBC46DRAFT_251481 [Diplogelasinospora grovesii]|uniref:Aminoglycoside phosphotransferase domain-containing protein n=1 Tax=Diplogelasinospora grovesii TaxID=303347 RepID=A0AAN6S966_9PEZI|nr:hypothetical protein QBC46DRAFT_251481 [Diplogelasinospora grovesii]